MKQPHTRTSETQLSSPFLLVHGVWIWCKGGPRLLQQCDIGVENIRLHVFFPLCKQGNRLTLCHTILYFSCTSEEWRCCGYVFGFCVCSAWCFFSCTGKGGYFFIRTVPPHCTKMSGTVTTSSPHTSCSSRCNTSLCETLDPCTNPMLRAGSFPSRNNPHAKLQM